jgi:hypothetical protein
MYMNVSNKEDETKNTAHSNALSQHSSVRTEEKHGIHIPLVVFLRRVETNIWLFAAEVICLTSA